MTEYEIKIGLEILIYTNKSLKDMSNLNVDLIISDRPNYGDNSAVSLYS